MTLHLVCSRCGFEVRAAEGWCWKCGTLNPPIEVQEEAAHGSD